MEILKWNSNRKYTGYRIAIIISAESSFLRNLGDNFYYIAFNLLHKHKICLFPESDLKMWHCLVVFACNVAIIAELKQYFHCFPFSLQKHNAIELVRPTFSMSYKMFLSSNLPNLYDSSNAINYAFVNMPQLRAM